MSIKSILNKLSEKAMNSDKFQKAWNTHAAVFGPIMENAFVDDPVARTHLIAALNNISRGEIKPAQDRMNQLSKLAKNDADKAAWLFFMGLLMETGNNRLEALRFYAGANQVGHSFYLPYLKLARHYHGDGGLAPAEKNYLRALECLKETGGAPNPDAMEASIRTNLAGCLTYMHRFDEAEEQLRLSKSLSADVPGRTVIDIALAAAQGDELRVRRGIGQLQQDNPDIADKIQKHAESILAGRDAHFSCQPANTAKIPEFWDWFQRNETTICNLLSNKDAQTPSKLLEQQMAPVFTAPEQRLSFGLRSREGGFTLLMCDNYSATRSHILQEFVAAWPKKLEPKWELRTMHSPHDEESD